MSKITKDTSGRISIEIEKEIKLNPFNNNGNARTFRILEELGSGGTAIAYKVAYEGSDDNRYLYVLKELYPVPAVDEPAIERHINSLDIDTYDAQVKPVHCYGRFRKQFEAAYRIQNDMATGENAVRNMTTSLPIGLYEDRSSSSNGNYALYGLFQYQVGKTLKKVKESSLLELVDIQQKIAEVVKAYHEHGLLWLDIKDSNVNVVGAGAVQSVSMFDFGSLFFKNQLTDYHVSDESDLALSFSPTSSDVLLPFELESILSPKGTSMLKLVDTRKNEQKIRMIGKYGEQTDIFLLGSLLFKRLMGNAPTVEDCEQLQNDSFDMSRFAILNGYSEIIVAKIKRILINCLHYEKRIKRYESVSAYMADLKELYLSLCTQESLDIVKENARRYVTFCCERYLSKTLCGDADGKFKHLKDLQGRFKSRVSLRSDNSQRIVPPSVAIDSASTLEDGSNHRLVFLYGDGGMGKSTACYDYMCETASITPIYIELSQYRFIDRDTPFVFKKIFEDICKKFIDVAGFINHEDLSRVEDILMESLRRLDPNDPRPQYVLLLDGYNEISKNDRGAFDNEIANIIDTWKNCRIVITGRSIPRDFEDKEIDVYNHFSRFEFVGISEEERKSLIEAKYPKRIEKIQQDKCLWEVLRIPMFMGMFLQLNVDTSAVVHTRGEILDQFITKTEKDVAEQIAKRQTGKAGNASLRSFLVQYGLPIIASEIERHRVFSINKLQLIISANRAWKVYDDDNGMMVGFLLDINVPEKPNHSNKTIIDILNVETGYCYKTTNGEYSFTHQYFRDYFAAKHIQNILNAAKALGENGLSKDEQLQFTKDNGLDYNWSDDVCILLGEIIGDYKNEPGYSEE